MQEATNAAIAPSLLTIEDVSRALRLGRSKVYVLVSTGEIPSVRIGGSRRIRTRDLDAYVERLGTPAAA